ncbi:MAG: nucleotidyl transferase AbiEii/AbiGii toxin family protein [Raoultibacter sp.]
MAISRPNSKRNLDMALRRRGKSDEDFLRTRTLLANTIVAQMLPNGAMKGGSALKIRFGDRKTRATSDFDAARASDLDAFIVEFEDKLENGWNNFTARLIRHQPASPAGVPNAYVMKPFDVKLSYLGVSWCTVPFELGHDEIGDAEDPDLIVPKEASAILQSLGFPEPKAIPVMRLSHQIAQKIHGASAANSKRAHDLIDLQLVIVNGEINYKETRDTCERLFAYRKMQTWPPAVTINQDWDSLYSQQARSLDVLQNVSDAATWANELIAKIASESKS